jgi:hypothetical protein
MAAKKPAPKKPVKGNPFAAKAKEKMAAKGGKPPMKGKKK